jgi:hypothetical protein
MEGRPRITHPLGAYLDQTKDKSGMLKTRLKLPYWSRQEPQPPVDLSDEDICIIGSTSVGLDPSTMVINNSHNVVVADPRGTADGGFADLPPTADFTTTVIREPADGSHPTDQDSDFDEFSDSADGSAGSGKSGHVVTVTTGGGGSSVNGFLSGSMSNASSGFASAGQEENEISEIYYQEKTVPSIGQCNALYDYSANMYDELSIRVGDIINIHDKQEDGWWLGELRGQVGIFPATYVEDI